MNEVAAFYYLASQKAIDNKKMLWTFNNAILSVSLIYKLVDIVSWDRFLPTKASVGEVNWPYFQSSIIISDFERVMKLHFMYDLNEFSRKPAIILSIASTK